MLILKSQQFNDESLLAFAMDKSTVLGGVSEKILHWDFGPIMNMKMDINAKNYLFSSESVPFHWDGAFHVTPKKLLFYCENSQGLGGETLFANTEKIWRDLNESEREICKKITLTYETKKLAHYGGSFSTSLVLFHPDSHHPILRIAERVKSELNPVDLKITGVSEKEGAEFYEFLVSKLYDSKYVYEHRWEKGDLVLCDNYTYLHGRKSIGKNIQRSFKRIQIL